MSLVKSDKNLVRYVVRKVKELELDEAELIDLLIPWHVASALTRSPKGLKISSSMLAGLISSLDSVSDEEELEKAIEMSQFYSNAIVQFLSNLETRLRKNVEKPLPDGELEN